MLRRMLTLFILLTALLAGMGSSALADDDTLVPAARQALILVRVLAYDQDLTERAGTSLTIAILYLPGDEDSEALMEGMSAAFGATTKLEVQGLPLSVSTIAYEDADTLRAHIDAQGIDALYIAGTLTRQLETITAVSREKKVATMTPYKENAKAGVAIAVYLKGDKPGIVINLAASKAEGLNLSSDLLSLAETF